MKSNRRRQLLGATAILTLLYAAQVQSSSAPAEQILHLTAKKFEYSPNQVTVKKGQPVLIEIVSLDRKHGFTIPDLKVRSDVKPGAENVVRFTPDRAGTFNFHCDLFCGSGHEGMTGTLVVVEQ